jgi:hypothetical protein
LIAKSQLFNLIIKKSELVQFLMSYFKRRQVGLLRIRILPWKGWPHIHKIVGRALGAGPEFGGTFHRPMDDIYLRKEITHFKENVRWDLLGNFPGKKQLAGWTFLAQSQIRP